MKKKKGQAKSTGKLANKLNLDCDLRQLYPYSLQDKLRN